MRGKTEWVELRFFYCRILLKLTEIGLSVGLLLWRLFPLKFFADINSFSLEIFFFEFVGFWAEDLL
jgi:hypothetical protein